MPHRQSRMETETDRGGRGRLMNTLEQATRGTRRRRHTQRWIHKQLQVHPGRHTQADTIDAKSHKLAQMYCHTECARRAWAHSETVSDTHTPLYTHTHSSISHIHVRTHSSITHTHEHTHTPASCTHVHTHTHSSIVHTLQHHAHTCTHTRSSITHTHVHTYTPASLTHVHTHTPASRTHVHTHTALRRPEQPSAKCPGPGPPAASAGGKASRGTMPPHLRRHRSHCQPGTHHGPPLSRLLAAVPAPGGRRLAAPQAHLLPPTHLGPSSSRASCLVLQPPGGLTPGPPSLPDSWGLMNSPQGAARGQGWVVKSVERRPKHTRCVTLGKSLCLSEPQFPHLQNGIMLPATSQGWGDDKLSQSIHNAKAAGEPEIWEAWAPAPALLPPCHEALHI
ncbi:uncharacterized protein LOC131418342 [Diceros bicornis minor]|uniref:uncharacterized protein LOC131418342 n=1 Tax=Diceros bicornis minor TaxID=77932 RepID=UPI0026EB6EFC|nr:uncharacterized protein LOC131418342 [Diceros bicornis minor]XP_058418467.1 uncharacterized protein LOC131418342 [Diceros bicornis minor]